MSRHVAGNSSVTIDPVTAIAEDVDQGSDVAITIIHKTRSALCLLQQLRHDGGQRKLHDPEARPDRLTRAVELLDEEIATPDAEALFLQLLHECHD